MICDLAFFLTMRALHRAHDAQGRGPPHLLSLGLGAASALGGAGADKIALHVRQSAENGNHQAPGAGAGIGPRLGQ
jgi:hypothetical protein